MARGPLPPERFEEALDAYHQKELVTLQQSLQDPALLATLGDLGPFIRESNTYAEVFLLNSEGASLNELADETGLREHRERAVTLLKKAVELGRTLPKDQGLVAADIILSTTGAAEPVVSYDRFARLVPHRGGRHVAVIDIAVPRDFDPRIAKLDVVDLLVNVDEADVGSMTVGLKATFTVSAYPNRKYPATVNRVAYGSTTTDNVVTYQAQLDVDNQDLSLRPGMTATATITATERQQVLLVPNTALRFTPGAARTDAPAAAASGARSGIVGSLMPRAPGLGGRRGSANAGSASAQAPGQRQLWVLRDGQPVAITVTTGLTDGRLTEVSSDQLQPGMQVITDQRSGATK